MSTSPSRFEELFAREGSLRMLARHRGAMRQRRTLVGLTLLVTAFEWRLGFISAPYRLVFAVVAGHFLMNEGTQYEDRHGRAQPWHFWLGLTADVLVLSFFVAVLGPYGYFCMPFFILSAINMALGMPGVARIQLLLSTACFAAARILAFHLMGVPVPWAVIALDVFHLGFLTFAAMQLPSHFTGRVRRARVFLAGVEQGDLGTELKDNALDDMGFLAVSINSMVATLGGIVREIQQEASQLAAFSEQVAATAQATEQAAALIGAATHDVARDAEQQLTLVSRVSSAVSQVAGQNEAARADALRSAAAAHAAAGDASSHTTRVQAMGTLLAEVGSDFASVVEAIGTLERSRDRVSQFVTLTREIAGQTNLLALNAAIEAARAGEHGRGFGVVADEVKKLSEHAATAAGDVSESVAAVHAATDEMRRRIDAGRARIADISAASSGGNAALAALLGSLRETTAFIEELAPRIDRQATSLADHVAGMREIEQLAHAALAKSQHNAAITQEQVASMSTLASAGRHLTATAGTLRSLTARFTVAA